MRVHFIPNGETEIAFFPDSLRYFTVNTFTKELINHLLSGSPKEVYLQQSAISVDEYDQFALQLNEVAKPLQFADGQMMDRKFLERLVLNISNDCNMRCRYCYANGGSYLSDAKLMTEEVALRGLRHAMDHFEEIRLIQLFGGEPFLNLPVVEAIAEKVEEWYPTSNLKAKPTVGLVTNGTIVNEQVLELIQKYQLVVTVSLDGPKMVNDLMRVFPDGSGVFDVVAANIKRMKEATGQPTAIEVTYHSGHVQEKVSVMDIVHFFQETFGPGIRSHIVPVDCGAECSAVLADYEPFVKSVDDAFATVSDGRMSNYMVLEGYIDSLEQKKSSCMLCSAGINTIAIASTGEIYPCFMFVDREDYRMGTVFADSPFTQPEFLQRQKPFRDFSKDTAEPCGSCFINRICKGCYWRNEMFTGDIFAFPEEYCEMNRRMVEATIVNLTRAQG